MADSPKTLLQTPRFEVVERVIQTSPEEPQIRRQVVVSPGAVAIIPLLDDGRVCLIRNFRIAVGKTLIELPAGTIEQGEPPSATACRELQEETGYTAMRWRELPAFFMSPGILNEQMYLFVAEGLVPGEAAREAGEEIENLIVPWKEAVAMAENGEIIDAKSLVGILRWDRLRHGSS